MSCILSHGSGKFQAIHSTYLRAAILHSTPGGQAAVAQTEKQQNFALAKRTIATKITIARQQLDRIWWKKSKEKVRFEQTVHGQWKAWKTQGTEKRRQTVRENFSTYLYVQKIHSYLKIGLKRKEQQISNSKYRSREVTLVEYSLSNNNKKIRHKSTRIEGKLESWPVDKDYRKQPILALIQSGQAQHITQDKDIQTFL